MLDDDCHSAWFGRGLLVVDPHIAEPRFSIRIVVVIGNESDLGEVARIKLSNGNRVTVPLVTIIVLVVQETPVLRSVDLECPVRAD